VCQQLRAEGYGPEEMRLQRSCDLRYVGQKYELTVALPEAPHDWNIAALQQEFHLQHEALYAYRTAEPGECMNVRLAVLVPQRQVQLPEVLAGTAAATVAGERQAFFPETGTVAMPVYQRQQLGRGASIHGPAVVEDEWSTTLLYPGQRLRVERWGTLLIEDTAS
jgi:N-methylhydantoinase A